MIHADIKRLERKYGRLIFLLNLPSIAAVISLLIIVYAVLRGAENVPAYIYRTVFFVLYCSAVYSFVVTLAVSVIETLVVRGHKNDTYIEIFNSVMVVSRHSGTGVENGSLCDYKKLWVIALADIEKVSCLRSKMVISAKARCFEGKSRWLGYETDEKGDIDFDYWWYNENGGENLQNVEFQDVYTYSDRIAQRIIFCSEKCREREIRRQEFRKRMLEIAGRSKKAGRGLEPRYKRSERVFRGGDINRNF